LVSQVTLGQVGIIFSYDVTRLSRNCSGWYQLLDLCGFRRCLTGDRDGIYDPSCINGRLLPGLKGQISEPELHTIKARLHAGLINKARRGDLAMGLPVGLMRDTAGRTALHPNQEVRDRIAFVFATFLRVRSVQGVVRELAASRLLLPRRERGWDDGAVVWRRPTVAAVTSTLRNPAHAGTFVYGRTRYQATAPGGPPRKCPLPPDQWQFTVHDKYPACIDRDTQASILGILHDNYLEYASRRSRGVARGGAALLQGLVYCARCGNKMTVMYHAASRHLCNHHKLQFGGKECQRLPMAPIDAWVVERFWEALSAAELGRYDEAVAALDGRRQQARRAREQQIQRLGYEARVAEKQYRLVDPENRLVASELERRWEQALRAPREAEEDAARANAEGTEGPLGEELRRRLDEARPTLRQMWDNGSLTNARKKELLRALIDEGVLNRAAPDRCEVRIIWKGGDWTEAKLPLAVVAYAEMANGAELIAEVLRRAKAGQTDARIAEDLTAEGYHSPPRSNVTRGSVTRIRTKHGAHSGKVRLQREGLPGWITLGQAAKRLQEHTGWVYYLIRQKRLVIRRDREFGQYLVRNDKAILKQLKELLRGKRFSLTIEPRAS
jgi:DNA invertase Pin-like site-specific DNA recombinase